MIACFLAAKGGTSKTTLAINLAAALAAEGQRTLLYDADPQQTVGVWLAHRGMRPTPFDVRMPGDGERVMPKMLAEAAAGYDAVVIDGPPHSTDVLISMLAVATHALISAQPSTADIRTQQEILALRDRSDIAAIRPQGQRVAWVLARRMANTTLHRTMPGLLAAETDEVPVLVGIANRIIYQDAFAQGETVYETDRRGPAAAEITVLLADIKGL